MKRKCSVCKEKGHDKRQCPIQREKIQEEITFRRERLNLFFAKAPELLNNPVLMGLLWWGCGFRWRISKKFTLPR